MITVIDYGTGNLRSVSKALETVGAETKVSDKPEDIVFAKAIVLPGVGAFYRGMENINKLGILPAILEAIRNNKPFLGICLGLQLLFSESEEHGICKGLDIIKGKVKKFEPNVKIPHMGWNQLRYQKTEDRRQIFNGIPDNSYFYFDHSYYVEPEDKNTIIATTRYGKDFVSAVNKDNIWGVQFHPEKSSDLGLKILENFVKLTKA
ncbi:MAG: imidazole glycerol phosphate synthase subunit HisH [Candidatus Omnitrophica bacterium]|nr:imidazole glycerol phosphate synthase subunit HisH [Candidatus Omnitrophota bacterium]MBU1047419.1 imidazole glycerol phosphate synthase subunit HisH [Candidatus Omnitrophota bacterium]MBU1630824.1 imidazole glycerol phosphate synthase subunit HisH [Candidatus Omnitrophota bacterium]MBU1767482.1 imidazole glycerol phosphate synthase subunit HisH [Candidatus Omnitrophota bacterium]MBU1888783.1 imidazole glycerol phosphate synthase subunit HisH [Candidatus Omnitrophota bacterium]